MNRLGPNLESTSLINSPSSPAISQRHNQTLQPPATPRHNGSNVTSNITDEDSNRNSLGIWSGSKSAASTPNLVGNVGRSPTADFSSSSITVASNNSTFHTQAQVQAGADSGASVDSQTSPSFQQRRKRSESTGGFKNTAGNITRLVKKSSSNFLRKLVKNFDDKDAPPIPTAQTSNIAASMSSPSPRQPTHRSATLPDLPSLTSIAPGQTQLGPLSTPPPLSPLMGQELVSHFANIGPSAQTGEPLNMYQHAVRNPNIQSWLQNTASNGALSDTVHPHAMPPPSAFSPADLTASLAMLTHDDIECDDDEDDEGELDEDEDEDMPTNISNRLSRLYESGSLHLNQSQTSLYYSTKSYLSDSEAAELASRRASMAQDPLGYSLGLSRGNSIRFSQYSLHSLHSTVAPMHSSSPPSSPGLEGRSGPNRRPISLFLPLTTPLDTECDDKTEVGEGESAGDVETEEVIADDDREPTELPHQHEFEREQEQEQEQESGEVVTAELMVPGTPNQDSGIGQEASSGYDGPAIVCQSPRDAPAGASRSRPLSTHLSQQDQEAVEESVSAFEGEAEKKASIQAAETAKRLFDEDETLMKREEIAAYMATPNVFYRSILVHYMSYFDFSGLRLDMAFRALCQKLVLKGESQEVDRVLEAFAGRYVICNPRTLLGGADHAKDVVHAITYSVLLLNTDLHVVRQSSLSKMSRSAFIKNTLQVVQQSSQDRSEDISSSSSRPVMSVDSVGLGLPRSLTAESSLEPISPTGSKRRTPSVKSWKSGNSQQSTGPVGSNVSANTQPYSNKMGTDPRANCGHGNGKLWQHELETLLKDIYTAVKQNQILLPVAATPPVSRTRAGSRSNTLSSPPASPVVSGFGSSFLSNRMSRLINPSSFSAGSNNTQSFSSSPQQQHQHLQPIDSGLGMLGTSGNGGGFGLGISGRRSSVSARTQQLRNEAIQRLSAQANSPDGTGESDYVVVSPPISHSSTFGFCPQFSPNSSLAAPLFRSNPRYSIAGSIYNEANVLSLTHQHDRDLNINRGPMRAVMRGNEGQQSQFSSSSRLSTLTLNTSMSESTNTTTPSASQNSLASLQSLGPRAGIHPHDTSYQPGEDGPHDFMLQDDDSVSIQEQKDLWHQHHLQTRYRMEGILWRKHLLERADKKAQHRAWRQLLVVLDQERGTLSMFRSDGSLPSVSTQPQSNSGSLAPPLNDSDASMPLFDDIPLQHTITNILPPPGYSTSRRHVFALQLFTGAVYLFQTKTPQECESWARTCNYWASRTSKEPLVGGVVNMEYGWGRALDGVMMALQAEESACMTSSGIDMVESPGPMRSQGNDYLNYPPPTTPTSAGPIDLSGRGRSASIKSGTRGSMSSGTGSVSAHMGSSMPAGDRITLFEWTAPMPTMSQSLLMEEEQMQALKRYVAGLEAEMEAHQEHRVPMMRLFHPKSSNYAKAFNNWERRSRHLLKEMVKYQIYVECLEQSIQYQFLFLEQQRQRMNQFESSNPNYHPQQHQHRLDELQHESEEQSLLEAVELAGNGGGIIRQHNDKNVDVEAELEALVVREGPPRSWIYDGPLSTLLQQPYFYSPHNYAHFYAYSTTQHGPTTTLRSRSITQSVLSKKQSEGLGARVRRSIGRPELCDHDPFLMLDEFDVDKNRGFPDHPHRGFETVTYMLEGQFQHEDFADHK
ncbi:hypothetical protein BGZ47_007143 [Haplosporangium gracile]|nr:hypothetical protein BGZ47_007143 [Haplosporangium gracile]